MYLQLAENHLSDRFKPQSIRYTPQSVRYGKERGGRSQLPKTYIDTSGFNYGSGMSPAAAYSGMMSEPENPFIYVPDPTGTTGGMYVREDHFDNMNSSQWRQMMANLAPYQPSVQNGVLSEGMFLNDRAARKAKREDKKAKKEEKKETKQAEKSAKKESKVQSRDSKSAARETKADAKRIKAESGDRPGKDILTKLIDTAGSFLPGAKKSAEDEPEEISRKSGDKKPFYKNPYVIGAGILILAGGAYAISTRNK